MNNIKCFSLILFFLVSCGSSDQQLIEGNKLITPQYEFSAEFFECNLNEGYTLLNLESFISSLTRSKSSIDEKIYDVGIFFPNSDFENKFMINLKNYSNNNIYELFLNEISTRGFDQIASCNFKQNNFKGLSVISSIAENDKSSHSVEILRCVYNKGFNYGSFRVAIDRFNITMEALNIPYEALYLVKNNDEGEFTWINNFYVDNYSDLISSEWISMQVAEDIKQEFSENAKCVDAKSYDVFYIL